MLSLKNTLDGSNTLYSDEFKEHYHSINGALNESMHIFINAGLNYCKLNSIRVFELGFGTGLNAILTFIESLQKHLTVEYTAIELYPINADLIKQLNYIDFINKEYQDIFNTIHACEWNKTIKISRDFSLTKINADFNTYIFSKNYDLFYFDAFSPDTQPEMWNINNFIKIYNNLNKTGILTTYSSKGIVKNNLRTAGFKVTRLKGPKGKHHILRAVKL